MGLVREWTRFMFLKIFMSFIYNRDDNDYVDIDVIVNVFCFYPFHPQQ